MIPQQYDGPPLTSKQASCQSSPLKSTRLSSFSIGSSQPSQMTVVTFSPHANSAASQSQNGSNPAAHGVSSRLRFPERGHRFRKPSTRCIHPPFGRQPTRRNQQQAPLVSPGPSGASPGADIGRVASPLFPGKDCRSCSSARDALFYLAFGRRVPTNCIRPQSISDRGLDDIFPDCAHIVTLSYGNI